MIRTKFNFRNIKGENSLGKLTYGQKGRWSKMKILLSMFLVLTLLLSITGCGKGKTSSSAKTDSIVIATKGFAESDILANMLKILVENDTNLKVEIKTLDNKLLWDGVKRGEVDAYVEYTSTALLNILKLDPIRDPNKVYKTVSKGLDEKYKIKTLDPIGFNSSYGMALRKETARKLGITNISNLSDKSKQLVFGASQEYMNRPDSWPILEKAYNFKFKEIKTIQQKSLQYKAVEQELIDSMIVYTTDSKILSSNLVVLNDDKHVFLPYYAVPLVRENTLKQHPKLKDALNKLAGKITDKEIKRLNSEVDLKQKLASDVAKEWLQGEGLIK